jgi:hypothetical protein
MAQRMRFSPRDECYLNATRFEVYIAAGLVFVIGFTLVFMLSVMAHAEVWIWPGSLIPVGAAFYIFRILKRREYAEKLRELEADYSKGD